MTFREAMHYVRVLTSKQTIECMETATGMLLTVCECRINAYWRWVVLRDHVTGHKLLKPDVSPWSARRHASGSPTTYAALQDRLKSEAKGSEGAGVDSPS